MTTHLFALGDRARIITAIAALLLATLLTTDPAAARTPSRTSATLVQGIGMGAAPSVRVRALQRALARRGYNLGAAGVDGRFGPMTAAAVRGFQARTGLAVDGIVGRTTRRALQLRTAAGGRVERRSHNQAPSPRHAERSAPGARHPSSPAHTAPGARHPSSPANTAPGRTDRKVRRPAEPTSPATGATARDRQSRKRPVAVSPVPRRATPANTPETTAPANPWLLPIALAAAAALLLAIGSSLGLSLARSLRDHIIDHRGTPVIGGSVPRGRRGRADEKPRYADAVPATPAAGDDGRARGVLRLAGGGDPIARLMVRAAETGDEPPPIGERVIGYVPVALKRRSGNGSEAAGAIKRICRAGGWNLVDVVREQRPNGHHPPPTLISAFERVAFGEASALVVEHVDDIRRQNGAGGAVAEWLESHGTRLIVHDLERPGGAHVKRPPAAAITLDRRPVNRAVGAGAS